MQAFLSPSPLHLSPSLPRTRCASHSHLRRLPRQRRPRASATPAPTPPPPPPPPPLARLPDALRGVNETAPFYVALAAAQTMPFVAPSRGTLVDVAYFGITAICALVIGCKRSPLQSAELQTPLTGRQVAVAPVAASVTLFGAYLILHYTPLDIGFVFNLMTTFIGGLCLKEALDPLMVSALRVAGVENRPVANIEEPETVEEEVPQVDLSDALSAATAAAVIVLYLIPPSLLPAAIGDLHFVFSNTIAIGIAARVLSLIRPDSFLAAAGLLCGLCLYDIFAVFLSPLFAPGGESVMVAVALKIDSPGKLLFPRDPASLASATSYPFAVLGLGDLIVPGVFMTLALALDAFVVQKRDPTDPQSIIPAGPYFRASIVAYILGLGTCFGANFLTSSPQPALLYLVPALVSSALITASARGELKEVWGFRTPTPAGVATEGESE